MELIQGSETSANYNLTPGKFPEENIKFSAFVCTPTPSEASHLQQKEPLYYPLYATQKEDKEEEEVEEKDNKRIRWCHEREFIHCCREETGNVPLVVMVNVG